MTFSTNKMNTKINLLFFFLCITFYSFAQKGNSSIKPATLNNGEVKENNNIRAIDAQTEDKLELTGKSEIEEKRKSKATPDASVEEKKKEELKLKNGADSKEAMAKNSVNSNAIVIPCILLPKVPSIIGEGFNESLKNLVIVNKAYALDYNNYSPDILAQLKVLTNNFVFDDNTALMYIMPYLEMYKNVGTINYSSVSSALNVFFKANALLASYIPDNIKDLSQSEKGIVQLIEKQNLLFHK
jgi:hypothetical protein